jgi:hypothetical protein
MTESARGRATALAAAAAGAVTALPAAVLAAPFWVAGALTRWLPQVVTLGPRVSSWPELLEYVPEVGWRSRPNLDAYAQADELFHVTTDDEGWRGRLRIEDADLVVFGDSYAFGHGVDDEEVYSQHAGDLAVKALGSDGYSMVHAVLWMERLRDRIAGKTVLWMVYAANDLYDNLRPNYGRYRMPYVRKRHGRWEIHTDHVSQEPWPCAEPHAGYLTEFARLCTPGLESARAVEAAAYLIHRAGQVCEEAGASLLVLSVPRREQIDSERLATFRERSPDPQRFDPSLPDEGLSRACEEAGVPFVALAGHLRAEDYQIDDIHWTPAGNAKVGRLLAAIHEKRLVPGTASPPWGEG